MSLALGILLSLWPGVEEDPVLEPDRLVAPVIVAMGGDARRHPENTFPALDAALDLKVSWLLIDVSRTRDGHLLALRGPTTAFLAEQNLIVEEQDLATLAELDIAHGFRAEYRLTREQCPATHVVKLEDVVTRVLAAAETTLVLHLRQAEHVEPVTKLLDAHQAKARTAFVSPNLDVLVAARAWNPEAIVLWERNPTWRPDEDVLEAREASVDAILLHQNGLGIKALRALREAEIRMGVTRLSDARAMQRALDEGFEVFLVPDPKLFFQELEKYRRLEEIGR